MITIYHNPACSNSRGALAILEEAGAVFRIVEYLKTPLTRPELEVLARQLKQTVGPGWSVREMMRVKEPLYTELALDRADEEALLTALTANPTLLNRPIVVAEDGRALLCRPPERVRELLKR